MAHLSTLFCYGIFAYAQVAAAQDIEYDITTGSGGYLGKYERTVKETDRGTETTTRQTLQIRADDTRPRTVISERTMLEVDGIVSRIDLVTKTGAAKAKTVAIFDGETAEITRSTMGDIRVQKLKLPSDIRFDNGAGLLAEWSPSQRPEVRFHILDPSAPRLEDVVYDLQSGSDADTQTVRRRTFVDGKLFKLAFLTVDETGKLTAANQPMFGEGISKSSTSRRSGFRERPPSLVESVLVKSPYRIPASAMNKHLRYTFSLSEPVKFLPPQTAEQNARQTENGFTLDICDNCGLGLPTHEAYLSAARQPTFWLQSDHRLIQRAANRARRNNASDHDVMESLSRWGSRRMKVIDFAGHFSALEALKLKRGDCTEGATVLAALGRAAGIPTKVVSGIVYSREQYHGVSHTFMPHAWVLAYVDGEWKSFDMSLDGFDSTHIALNINDGDPSAIQAAHQMAALLEWGPMTEVRKRPKN